MKVGTIIQVFGRYYTVFFDGKEVVSVLRGKLKKDKRLKIYSEPAVVGDMVSIIAEEDGTGIIEEVHERKNVFTRKDRGFNKEDLIASNLDQIVVVQSYGIPKFNVRFVDRILVRAEKEDIPVILCMNKCDEIEIEDKNYIEGYYSKVHIEVVTTSAKNGTNIEELRSILDSKQTIFVGNSGVGKSTLLNALYKNIDLKTSHVSEKSNKGRHTTTNVQMILQPNNTKIIDTPGVREFGLLDIEPEELSRYFNDLHEYSHLCKFNPCTHDHEPKCAVKDMVENGEIHSDRHVSYLHILNSIREYYKNRW